jgi:hypothetical protein
VRIEEARPNSLRGSLLDVCVGEKALAH